MANCRKPGPLHPPTGLCRIPARTNGTLGLCDQGDPNVTTLLGDTPGPAGCNDGGDPTMGSRGAATYPITIQTENLYSPGRSLAGDAYRTAAREFANPDNSLASRTGYGISALVMAIPGFVNDAARDLYNFPNEIYVGGQNLAIGWSSNDPYRFSTGLMQVSIGMLAGAGGAGTVGKGVVSSQVASKNAASNVAARATYKDGANSAADTVKVFRVEGGGNQRLLIDEAGNVKIPELLTNKGRGPERNLYLNFGDEARAQQFLEQRLQQFPDNTIKSFDVSKSFLDELRATAVPEAQRSLYPTRPVIADPTKAPNQYGLTAEQLQKLRQVIVKGSGGG